MAKFVPACIVILMSLAGIGGSDARAFDAVHPLQQALLNLTLTVQSEPVQGIAITGDKPGATNYTPTCDDQESVTLTAPAEHTAAGGVRYDFLKWTLDGADGPEGGNLAITMDADHTAVAVYAVRTWTLTVQSDPIAEVAVTGGKPGTTDYAVTCDDQESVTLTAPAEHTAAGGVRYDFVKWTLDGADGPEGDSLALTMDADHTAVAVYAIRTWTLTVQSDPIAEVAVTGGKPGTTNYTATCDDQESVTLTAPAEQTAAGGVRYDFVKWTLDGIDGPEGNNLAITMDADHTAAAVYAIRTWTLTVQSDPIAEVAITGGKPGTTDYAVTCDDQESVALTAPAEHTAAGGVRYDFVKWTLDAVDGPEGNNLAITMDADHTAAAVYAIRTWTLTVQSDPIAEVAITGGKPGTTNYAATCDDQEAVTLTAPAEQTTAGGVRYDFVKWTLDGIDGPEGGNLAITMDADHTAAAVYAIRTWTLTVQSDPIAEVAITGDKPGTTNYTATCNDQESVTLTALSEHTAAGGVRYDFVKWTLDGADRPEGNSLAITMDADHTAVAVYAIRTWTLTVQSDPIAEVAITGDKPGTTDYAVTCDDQESVTLTAPAEHTAAGGVRYDFVKWTLDGVDGPEGGNLAITMDADHTVVAIYAIRTWTFTVQSDPIAEVAITGDKPGTTNYTATCNDQESVTLTAPAEHTAAGGVRYNFVKWTVDGSDAPPGAAVAVTTDANRSVIAVYEIQTWTLTVESSPVAGISIGGSKPGTSGATAYSATLNDQTAVTLTAPAVHTAPGGVRYNFVKWSLDGVDRPLGQTSLTVTMAASHAAAATYQIKTWSLSVQSLPVTGINITGAKPGRTNYAAVCDDRAAISLTAPDAITIDGVDYGFAAWTLDGSPMTPYLPACQVQMNTNHNLQAVYRVPPAGITDLTAEFLPDTQQVVLEWTSAGGVLYDLRCSRTGAIDDWQQWEAATQLSGEPSPAAAGTRQSISFTLDQLPAEDVIHFNLRVIDETPMISFLSNSPFVDAPDQPPAAIADLAVTDTTAESLTISFTATGDDGTTGIASAYDVRWSTAEITASSWEQAQPVANPPAPQAPGTIQTITITGLQGETFYCVAIKVRDDLGLESELSNVAWGMTIDQTPPATIQDLQAELVLVEPDDCNGMANAVLLSWTAPGDSGATGTAASFDLRWNYPAAIDATNWPTARPLAGEPAPQTAGTRQSMLVNLDSLPQGVRVHFAMTAVDEAANASGISNSPFVQTPARLVGDVNSDGAVNILDLIAVRGKLNQDAGSGDNWRLDVNNDFRLNILDLIEVRKNIGKQCGQP